MRALALALLLLTGTSVAAQTNLDLGGLSGDTDAPVEITADTLSVDQAAGTAEFSGSVVIGQGELRLAADRVNVTYDEASGAVTRMQAEGNVTFVTAAEAAEAQSADYDVVSGTLTLTGDVLLTQGPSAIAAERMVVDLGSGTARMEGRVRTVFQPQGGN